MQSEDSTKSDSNKTPEWQTWKELLNRSKAESKGPLFRQDKKGCMNIQHYGNREQGGELERNATKECTVEKGTALQWDAPQLGAYQIGTVAFVL